MIRIDVKTLKRISNVDQERNIYIHPNPVARDIFWQRLEKLHHYITQYTDSQAMVLDFGGGSGVFAKSLCEFFNKVDLVDLDTSCAQNIQKEFNLNNLETIEADINELKLKEYDVIIAADVLEHFLDLAEPIEFLKAHLKKGGLLMVSLPTENLLYEIGRKIVNKQKPADHYHPSAHVIDTLCHEGFDLLKKRYAPTYVLPIPLFEVAVLTKS